MVRHVDALEARIRYLEATIGTVCIINDRVSATLTSVKASPQVAVSPFVLSSSAPAPSPGQSTTALIPHTSTPTSDGDGEDGEEARIELLSERIQKIELDALTYTGGLGASSGGRFVDKVARLKDEQTTQEKPKDEPLRVLEFVGITVCKDAFGLPLFRSGNMKFIPIFVIGK
jgi:hypothetical protein